MSAQTSQTFRQFRWLLVLLLTLVVPVASVAQALRATTHGRTRAERRPTVAEATTIRTVVQSGRLTDLRWPVFTDVRGDLDQFYRGSGYALAWIHDGMPTDRALQLIEALRNADGEGLNPEDYDSSRWPERVSRLSLRHTLQDQARFDVALSVCAMRYISAVRYGRIDPKSLNLRFDFEQKQFEPKRRELAPLLRQVVSGTADLQLQLASFEPPSPDYAAARQALRQYMQLAAKDSGKKLPPPPLETVYPGGRYEGVPRLVELLKLLGDLPQDASVEKDSYFFVDPLPEAVKRFQRRHGLHPSGNVTPETLEALNVPLQQRVMQLRETLERYRWFSHANNEQQVVVNVPAFRLQAYDPNGTVGLTLNVNVGDEYDFQTPVLKSTIEYVVFRPYWYLPSKIMRQEILPGVVEDRRFVQAENMEVISGDKVVSTGAISDAVLRELRAGTLRVRERPGPENALGRVKIMFPNTYHVYLHDTAPSRRYFFSEDRMLSHGCVHVQNPSQLVQWLLRDKPGWTLERVEKAMDRGPDNIRVNLTNRVPILIEYVTATVEDGEVHFYRDVYGRDAALQEALAKGYPNR